MNLSTLEEWVGQMGLPPGVQSHFVPVRDLLNWLQVRRFQILGAWYLICCAVSFIHTRLLQPCRYDPNDEEYQSFAGEIFSGLY